MKDHQPHRDRVQKNLSSFATQPQTGGGAIEISYGFDSTERIITVGGGKGGVGKSIVSSNLAVAMAQNGSKVVLVDCDLGAANQHVLFGIDRPDSPGCSR